MDEYLDQTLHSTTIATFLRSNQDLIKKCVKKYRFNLIEVQRLLLIYYKIQLNGNNSSDISTEQLEELIHCAFQIDSPNLMGNIIAVYTKGSVVSKETFMQYMHIFLRATLSEKIDYCFKVYDRRRQGILRNSQLVDLLSRMIISSDPDEDNNKSDIHDLLELVARRLDKDGDGVISYEDYRKSVLKEPFLLQVFGKCLPTRINVKAFLTTFLSSGKNI